MPKTVKGGSPRFVNSHSVFQNIRKLKGPFGDFEKFAKKMRIFNSLMLAKNLRDPLSFFNLRSVAKYQKKLKGGHFGDIKRFREKSHKAEKGRQVSVPEK